MNTYMKTYEQQTPASTHRYTHTLESRAKTIAHNGGPARNHRRSAFLGGRRGDGGLLKARGRSATVVSPDGCTSILVWRLPWARGSFGIQPPRQRRTRMPLVRIARKKKYGNQSPEIRRLLQVHTLVLMVFADSMILGGTCCVSCVSL